MSDSDNAAPEARPRRRPLLARLVGFVALLVLFAAPLAPALLRSQRPQLAVDCFFARDREEVVPLAMTGKRLDDAPKDPWGNPWHLSIIKVDSSAMAEHTAKKHWAFAAPSGPGPVSSILLVYSAGPDGHDDGGRADDVFPVSHSAAVWVPLSHVEHLLGALALVLAWWAIGILPRRRGRAVELVYMVVLASVPAALAVGGVLWTRQERSRGQILPPVPYVLVPQEAAVVASAAFVALLLAAGLRLAGAPRPEGTAADDKDDDEVG